MFLSPPSLSGSRSLLGAAEGFVLSQAKTLLALPISEALLQAIKRNVGGRGSKTPLLS